jgi:hypothetical protein
MNYAKTLRDAARQVRSWPLRWQRAAGSFTADELEASTDDFIKVMEKEIELRREAVAYMRKHNVERMSVSEIVHGEWR